MLSTTLLQEAIGTGLVAGLLFGELFAITPGGMVVPGYIALMLIHPYRVVGTIAIALLTFLGVRLLGRTMLLYGRRRFVVTVLLGFFLSLALERFLRSDITGSHTELRAIGFIIPGLLAEWMDHQGPSVTVAGLVVVAVITRLGMVMIFGSDIRV
jgi:poly-gamma-glutamate biosynthesis protein PgsC/CapC